MKKYLFILWTITLVLSIHVPTVAQDSTPPIFFLKDGDIWSYDPTTGALANRTGWGYTGAPILSPDGTQFAYLSVARVAVDAYENDPNIDLYPEPTNIWVWEMAADDAYRLVDQPANASVLDTGEMQNSIARRALTWSPDGGKLAWLENSAQLVIYDFASQTQRVSPIPISANVRQMRWGVNGIALLSETDSRQSVYVHDANSGALLWQTDLDDQENYILDYFWLESGQLGAFVRSGVAVFLDNGEITPMHGMPMLYSLNSPAPGNLQMTATYPYPNGEITWLNLTNNVHFPHTGILALSPNGSQGAFVRAGSPLSVNQNGIVWQSIRNTTVGRRDELGIVWGPVGWRESPVEVCPNSLPPRLTPGQQGRVLPGMGANVLRDLPGVEGSGSTVIGSIPPDGVFTVLENMRWECMSGIRWWYVEYEDTFGYTGEGQGTTYWVEPSE